MRQDSQWLGVSLMSDNHPNACLRCLSTQAASAVTQTLLWRKINLCILLFLFPLCYYKSHLRLALILQNLAEMRGRDAWEQAAFNYTVMNWHLPGLSHSIWSPIKGMIYGLKRGCSAYPAAWLFEFTSSNKKLGSFGKLRYLDANFTLWHRTQGKLQSVLSMFYLLGQTGVWIILCWQDGERSFCEIRDHPKWS